MVLLEKLRSGNKLSDADIKCLTAKNVLCRTQILNTLSEDDSIESNKHTVRVGSTFSGVELVHFCANGSMSDLWDKQKLGRSFGEVVFWYFIVPIFEDVRRIVGCQYAFLFAADLSEDGSLTNYYNVSLHFEQPVGIGTSKPFYDMCCKFMCQEISHLIEYRKDYFKNISTQTYK